MAERHTRSKGAQALVARPQAGVAAAERDAKRLQALRQLVPVDLTQAARLEMVRKLQVAAVGVPAVWQAMAQVPGHAFVDAGLAAQAYEDTALPLGHGQTISKPSVVARMLALLVQGDAAQRLGHLGRVLEVGTGGGYQAALLAQLARGVTTVERIGALAERARCTLADLGIAAHVVHGDGRLGHVQGAPYDTIVCAAGGDEPPAAWLEQLAPGGRLVAPVRAQANAQQTLRVVDRRGATWMHSSLDAVHFVPLKFGTE